MVACNRTLEDAHIIEDPLWQGFTFHHFGLFLAAVFGLISVVISLWLIMMHALHYLRPGEQKQIIRILFMIPIYSVVSFLSYLFYRKAIYFEVLRDCYEAFAISSFFALLCHYVAPNLHDQKDYFRTIQPKNWFWAVFGLQKCTGGENRGPFRKPRSGLTWFNIVWAGIFQYCFIRVTFTIVSVVSEALDRYCEASLNPAFAHIWVLAFESLAVTLAMFFVIQFYIQLKDDLAEHKPFLKVLSIKLVIFFSFWQTILISFVSSGNGPLQPTKTLAYQDIKIGIPSVALCIEMAGFSILHVFAYPWKPYSIKHMSHDPLTAAGAGYSGEAPKYQGGPLGLWALVDAFNPWDIIKASARGFRWMFVGVRHRHEDISYQPAKFGSTDTGYNGLGNATELRQGGVGGGGGGGGDAAYDDRTELLGHSPYPTAAGGARGAYEDVYQPPPHPPPPHHHHQAAGGMGTEFKPSDVYDDVDDDDDDYGGTRGYHPGMGPPPPPMMGSGGIVGTGPSGNGVHPAHRPGQTPPPPPPQQQPPPYPY